MVILLQKYCVFSSLSHFSSFMNKIISLLTICIAVHLWSCVPNTNSSTKENSDPVDKPAPTGYKPSFIRSTQPFTGTSTISGNPITRVDASEPSKVRIYAHIVDSLGTYYTGAADKKFSSVWCEVTDEFEGNKRPMKWKISEKTLKDTEPHALSIVMDHSGSMGDERARKIQEAAEVIINKKKDEDAVCLVKYDDKTVTESPLTTSKTELLSRLRKNGLIGFGGYTAIADGIAAGVKELMGVKGYVRKAVIVFTDGSDNSSKISKDSALAFAKRHGIAVCAVDFGYGVNESYLRDIATATGGSYTRIYGTEEFDDAFDDIYRRLRNYYVLEFTPPDYGIHKVTLRLCPPNSKPITSEFTYDNTPDIGSIALLNVYFDTDKSIVKPESKPALDNITTLMKALPAMKIEVRGHTDNTNKTKDADYNKKLSQKRADAVKQELIKRGLVAERISAVGYGETIPIADNSTEEGKSLNRRTEFVILSK